MAVSDINAMTSSPTSPRKRAYLPVDARERLLRYTYRSEDRSYVYKHMWAPLCRHTVEWLPVWLAPNVITVSALVFVCISHALIAYHMPNLRVDDGSGRASTLDDGVAPPPYIFLLAGASLFLYQLLDNLDGHQARRTGTSSPLGLLMDHGCDAVNCIIGSLSVAAAVAVGPCWKAWLIVLNSVAVFFMNTWEEYYRGALILPVINGPNEGLLIAIGIYLWTACCGGPQWWSANAIEIPSTLLPPVLQLPAPDVAVAVEANVLHLLCPVLTTLSGGVEILPLLLNVNCASTYLEHPTRPTQVVLPSREGDTTTMVSSRWKGQTWIQNAVLRMYGNNEGTLRIRYNTIMIALMTLGAILTCAGNVYQVYKAVCRCPTPNVSENDDEEDEEESSEVGISPVTPGNDKWFSLTSFRVRHPFLHALTGLIPLVVLTLLANSWFLTSQANIFQKHPRLFCWTIGMLYTKLSVHVMLAHICDCEFMPFRRTLAPFFIFGVHVFLTYLHNVHTIHKSQRGSVSGGGGGEKVDASSSVASPQSVPQGSMRAYNLDEELILLEFFLLSACTLIHLAYNVVCETAEVLSVSVFRVPKHKQDDLRRRKREEKAARKKKH